MGLYDIVTAFPSDNVASSATWAQHTGTLNTLYPLTRAYDVDPGTHTKSTTTTDYRLTLDWGAQQRQDALWMPMYGIPGGTWIRWEANATNSWASPSFVHSLQVSSPIGGLPVGIYMDLTQGAGYSASGFRWGSLFVPNPGRVTAVGDLFISPVKRTLPNLFMGLGRVRGRRTITTPREDGGEFSYDRGTDWQAITGRVRLNSATLSAFQTFWGECKGTHEFFPVTIDTHLVQPEGMYAKWAGELEMVQTTSRHRMLSVPWKVPGRGRAL